MKPRLKPWIALVGICASLQTCTLTQTIQHPADLRGHDQYRELELLTTDSTRYHLDRYVLGDSVLISWGSAETSGNTTPFDGPIRFSEIAYMKAYRTDVWSAVELTGIGIIFLMGVAGGSAGGSGTMQVTTYPIDSCPYLYSYDGERYHLESETFAGAVFRRAERASYDRLYHLRRSAGGYVVRVDNASPETDYVNQMSLLLIDAPPSAEVICDPLGRMHTLSDPVGPSRCEDLGGRDAMAAVRARDDLFWESDLSSLEQVERGAFRDGLVCEYPRSAANRQVKLVVRAGNTALGSFALQEVLDMSGRDRLSYQRELDQGGEETRKLGTFLRREGMLHVSVWQGGGWREQAVLPVVGPVLSKDQVAVLDVGDVGEERLIVRLESAAGVWRIDQVSMDDTADLPLAVREVACERAVDDAGRDVAPLLRDDDGLYYRTIRGQGAQLTFAAVAEQPGTRRSFVAKTKGYYHLWFTDTGVPHEQLRDRVLLEPLAAGRILLPGWCEVRDLYEREVGVRRSRGTSSLQAQSGDRNRSHPE